MSAERKDDTIHLAGDTIDTLLLALICLEQLWSAHPDVVRDVCIGVGTPELVDAAPKARLLIAALTGLRDS